MLKGCSRVWRIVKGSVALGLQLEESNMNARLLFGAFLTVMACGCSTSDGGVPTGIEGMLQPLLCKISTCRTPARLDLKMPTVLYSSESESAISTMVFNPSHELLTDFPVQFEIDPPSVAVITQTKGLRCTKTGNAVVLAHAGPATSSASISCRLVGRLVMDDKMRLIMPIDPVTPGIRVLDTEEQPILTLRPQLTVADEEILKVEDGKFIPRRVGVTRVTASAGDKHTNTLVTVVRKITNEPLLLNDGARLNQPLGKGSYEAEVKVRSGNTDHGVTLTWVGGSHCENKGESQDIIASCTIDTAGALIIENPTAFGLGPSADGYLALYEVP